MILQSLLVMKKATGNITKAKAYAVGVLALCVEISVCGILRVCLSFLF